MNKVCQTSRKNN